MPTAKPRESLARRRPACAFLCQLRAGDHSAASGGAIVTTTSPWRSRSTTACAPTMIDGLRELGLEVTRQQFPIVTENHLVQWELCKQGLGICIMMEEVGDAEPRVQRVLPEVAPIPIPLWLVCHRELRTSRRIRLVFERIADGLAGRFSAPS
jgi:DNA-binding transcriptional LysR family regulator